MLNYVVHTQHSPKLGNIKVSNIGCYNYVFLTKLFRLDGDGRFYEKRIYNMDK